MWEVIYLVNNNEIGLLSVSMYKPFDRADNPEDF